MTQLCNIWSITRVSM